MTYSKTMFWMLGLFAAAIFTPDMASAGGVIGDVLCNAVEFITTGVGAAIATLAVIVIGIGALMGKVSWGMAIIVALGIAIIFGAGTIADTLSGGKAGTC